MTTTPSTDWKEVIAPDEAQRFEAHAETLREYQRQRALRRPPVVRSLHIKAQAGVEAELTVLPDLPAHARHGLFEKPATHRAYVRYSNGRPVRQTDQKHDIRGIAIKVVGVEGKKLIPGMEDARTQDFLGILANHIPLSNADEFVWFVGAAASPATLLPKAILRFGFSRMMKILPEVIKSERIPDPISVATCTYFSALPIRFGPHAVKFSLKPHASNAPGARRSLSADYLGEELSGRLLSGPVTYDFRVQYFVDEKKTPIEDGQAEWKESDSPWLTVGRLVLPRQVTGSPRGQKVSALIEGMSFDPWHALVAHRPLGDLMRARSAAYRLSTIERKALPEPDGTENLDA